ncbi:MAG: DAK2 domain-containing protein [Clostridiales bacterium]|nr:DAK2 domain-containing protein [Clostridiales bacterium]
MNTLTIDAKTLQRLFLAGANRIDSQKEYINELNVFPVPDGDTGTNMTLTILSAAKEVEKLTDPTIVSLCQAISGGSLRGARGNSGVILSQLFRGFTRAVSKSETLDKAEIALGFGRAVDTAYKAVMKPKEGTILTVAKGMADKAEELKDSDMDLIAYCEAILACGYEVLEKTPDLLPVLKEAGVVDSGGQGLMEILQGIVDAMTGKVTEIVIPEVEKTPEPSVIQKDADYVPPADIKFGYCTEFIIMLNQALTEEEEQGLKDYLLGMGDSLVLVADDEICKVHVHTNHPGQAIEKALTFGPLSNMKIDNMRLEHQEKLIKDAEKVAARQRQEEELAARKKKQEPMKKIGFISISIGEGMTEVFKGLGVDYLIEGGQTMNPSTEDMLNAIKEVNAENIFILPNNKNIILAAEQARDLTEDKNIIVLPTQTIPQGIAAMVGYMPESDVEENKESMEECYRDILSGQVTYAVRDTAINGKTIHKGDIMGINDDGIEAVGTDINATTMDLITRMVDADSELLSLYYGEDVTREQAEELAEKVEAAFPDLEVETNFGGQPIYYYVLSVE